MLDFNTEKRNSQSEHGQPMAQTKGFICMCDSGVAGCQSQHQCHFGRIRSGLHGQLSLAAVNQMYVFSCLSRFVKGLLWKCKYKHIYTSSGAQSTFLVQSSKDNALLQRRHRTAPENVQIV